MILKATVLLIGLISLVQSKILLTSKGGPTEVHTKIVKNDGILLNLIIDNDIKLSAHIGRNRNMSEFRCYGTICFSTAQDLSFVSINAEADSSFRVEWNQIQYNTTVFNDCLSLNSSNVSWYGGPEVLVTQWPIEKLKMKNRPYISSKLDNGAVIEPYWLNSKGAFILVDEKTPLFVDQNNEINDTVCFKGVSKAPYAERTYSTLSYTLAAKNDSREAHLFAVNHYLGKIGLFPDSKMIKEPIWTTWGKYKIDINDNTVIEFLRNIYYHNFTKGQVEIDDKWEACYGDLTFDNKTRFQNINKTVAAIHKTGFRATLWVHPFVNTNCKVPVAEGIKNGYFVNSTTGNAITSWWNGNSSYVVDFTNPKAANWFKSRLMKLHDDYGIDGFKCDAGENDWLPEAANLENSFTKNVIQYVSDLSRRDVVIFQPADDNKPTFYEPTTTPNTFTKAYVKACAELGKFVEVRSAFRTQELSIFVRMLDKDSVWGNNNGLKSLVHSLLQFNMIGYTFVLPDLVGGNGYNGILPTPELLVRWTQANTFMPAIQFSYLPWELPIAPFNTTEIVRNFTNLREEYADVMIEAMWQSSIRGVPVNPPIWWVDPTDPVAQKVDDEFLLGEKILVAPVLEEGVFSRDIYLPRGRWIDGNNGTIYQGRRFLRNYRAPIKVLPYFLRF